MLTEKKTDDLLSAYDKLLKTEGPLCEKDEQARAIERSKKLQAEAIKKWREMHPQTAK